MLLACMESVAHWQAMPTLPGGHLTGHFRQGSLSAAGAALRPKRPLAQQMARGKQSEDVNLEEFDAACISMFDPNTWPQTRRDETFVTQANKLWTFLTEIMVRSSKAMDCTCFRA